MINDELKLEIEKINIICPICTQSIRVPRYKHINASCPKCNTKTEINNGNIIGYVGEKIIEKQVFIDKPVEKILTIKSKNYFSIILNFILSITLLFGAFYYNNDSQKLKWQNSVFLKILNNQPFLVEKIDFRNTTQDNTLIDDYSTRFSKNRIRYISPRIKIIPLFNDTKSIRLYIKFVNSVGEIKRNSNISPEGYSYKTDESIDSSTEYLDLNGWGDNNGDAYEIGTHRVEVWYNDKLLSSGTFEVTYSPEK